MIISCQGYTIHVAEIDIDAVPKEFSGIHQSIIRDVHKIKRRRIWSNVFGRRSTLKSEATVGYLSNNSEIY